MNALTHAAGIVSALMHERELQPSFQNIIILIAAGVDNAKSLARALCITERTVSHCLHSLQKSNYVTQQADMSYRIEAPAKKYLQKWLGAAMHFNPSNF